MNLVVVNTPANWPLDIPGVELVAARTYLSDRSYSEIRGVKLFNLCRSYSYQSLGYYVSMLAEARGHVPKPSIATIQDFKMQALTRIVSEDLDKLMQSALAPLQSSEFVLSIYFGQPLAQRYRRLALQLYNQFQAPLLRARFGRDDEGWTLHSVAPVPANELPDAHRPFVVEAARQYFANRLRLPRREVEARYDLAILQDPKEETKPSNTKAIERFQRAAEELGMASELITRDDYGRLAEFDALFIRQTTAVNHYTYRFARRAEASGMIVVDDPRSIVRCANKVYLAELLQRHELRVPRSLIVHRDNRHQVASELGFPCVLKQPDSAFSRGVIKVDDEASLARELERLLEESELIVAQEFIRTDFDWRVGIYDRRALFVCRYHMARRHWQILKREADGDTSYGRVDTLLIEEAPPRVVRAAVRAAKLIGDGLYGVDLKQIGRRVYIIEINDNPNIDAGFEDRRLGKDLYRSIMAGFVRRIERRRQGRRRR